jgi:hypothetical protein
MNKRQAAIVVDLSCPQSAWMFVEFVLSTGGVHNQQGSSVNISFSFPLHGYVLEVNT